MAKPKIEDVTKTGPQSYRDLQRTNQEALQSASQVSPMANLKPTRGYRSSLDFVYEGAEQSPIQRQGKGDYWGNSMFDETSANEEDYMNLSDTRARNQPWYAQVAAGFAKGAILAGTTFLDGTLGLLFGAGTAANERRLSGLWDNDFSKAMQSVNEFSEELMPNYYTEEEQNSPWYENIFTANFLGDKFIKNLGFTIGAFYSGNIYSSGIGAAMKLMKASTKAATMVTSGTGAVLSAINEGRIEALNNSKDWYDTQKLQLDDTYQQRLADIQQEYESTKGHLSGSLETGFIDPAYERYQNSLAREQANYEAALGRLNEDRLKMGNVDLLMNIPILTASNIIQFGKLYARGFRTGRRANNIIGNITEGYRGGTTRGAGIRKAILDPLSEGTEEITQGMASRISGDYYADDADVTNYYKAKTDPEAQQKTLSWWKSFAQGINETVNDGSAWEEFFIGTLTGALGMPQFRSIRNKQGKFQSPITIEGGILGELRENREQIEREQSITDYMNSRLQSPEFKNYYQGLTRHQRLQDVMDQAIQDGDKFSFKNAEFAQFISDISMFDAAGKIGDLTTLINSAYDTSDENLQSIVNNTTSIVTAGQQALQINSAIQQLTQIKQDAEQRGDTYTLDQVNSQIQLLNDQLLSLKDIYVGPFIDSEGNPLYATEDGKQDMIDELTDTKNSMTKWIDHYVKIKIDLQSRLPQNIGDDQLEELIFLQSQVDNFEERMELATSIVKDILTEASTSLRTLASAQDIIGNTEDSERYNSDAEYIEQLIQDNTPKQLMQMLSNPKNNQFISWISSIINAYGNDVIRHLDKQFILKKIDDIAKMGQYKDLYQKRLQEYITNPSAQIQAHEQARQEQETTRKASQDVSSIDRINNSSVSDLVQASEDGEIDFDAIDGLFEEGEATDAKDKVEQAKDIIDTDRRAREDLEQLNSDGVISDQELADATALLNQSKSVSESSDELLDLDTESFNDPSILDDGDTRESIQKQAEEEGWSQEQIKSEFEDAMGQRLDKAKNALSTVKSFGLERDAKLSDIPSGTPQQATPTETIQTGHDSVDKNEPVNTPKQQQPDSNSTIANKIMSDAELSDEQAAKSIKEVLDYSDSLIKKDVKGSNLRDFLQATTSYQKVTKYGPKVLDALHKAINNKISQTQQSAPQQKQQAQPKQDDTTPIIMPSSIDEQINNENKRDTNNQGTDAFQEEVQKEGTSASAQKANGTYNYWRPSTTEFPIHRERGNDTPYWQTVKSDIRERLQTVYEYLKNHGVFSRVNNNQVKQGDEIHFGISKELSDKIGKPIILILNSKDEVIGDLPMPEDVSFNSYVGLPQLYEEASNWYKENHESLHTDGNDIAVIPGYKSRVARNMVGKPQYTSQNERNTLNQINTVTTSDGSQKQVPFRLGIAIANADSDRVRIMSDAGRSKSQGASPLERTIIAPLKAVKGQPFLLMPTSSSTRAFVTVPIMMPTFDMSNPSVANSALGQEISKKVQELTTISNNTDQIIKWINSMQELLAIPEIHVNFSTTRFSAEGRMPQELIVTIRRPGETTQTTIFKGPQEQAIDAVLNGLNGSMFQVSRKYINDTYNGRSYNEMIGELAETNLPIGATHTINDWFTIDPIVDKKQQKAHSPKSTRVNPTQTQGTIIRFQDASGDTYYLTSSNRLYKENPNGNDIELTDSKYNYLKAHAYGARIGETYTRPYDTPWGYYNPQTSKFEVKPSDKEQKSSQSTQTPGAQDTQQDKQSESQVTRQDSLDALKKMGLLNKKERNAALDKLSDDRLAWVAALPKLRARQILERFDTRIKANMDSNAINEVFDSLIDIKPLNREVTEQMDKAKSWNIEDEVQRVIKILPQLGRDGAIKFVDTLIEIARSGDPAYAWGQFQNGIITLSKLAARGTMYHEAFHFVTQSLLSKEELAELYKDARGKKKLTNLEVEEKLAEDFRRYMQSYEDNGFFINIFNKLKRFIKALVGKETITNKLFQDIRNGALASRTIIPNRVGFNRQETYTQEQQNILNSAPRDSQGRLLAPNGNPSNLNERQYIQVRTKAFKNWFGDWINNPSEASKVVDENGEPLVVYHTTTNVHTPLINVFEKQKRYKAYNLFYFSNNKDSSQTYFVGTNTIGDKQSRNDLLKEYKNKYDIFRNAKSLDDIEKILLKEINEISTKLSLIDKPKKNELKILGKIDLNTGKIIDYKSNQKSEITQLKSDKEWYEEKLREITTYLRVERGGFANIKELQTYPVFLNIKIPFNFDANHRNWEEVANDLGLKYDFNIENLYFKNKDFFEDGLIIENYVDTADPHSGMESTTFAVNSSNQIKSATSNTGEFSTTNNNIYYREVEQYYREKLDYGRLNQGQKDYITERGLTIEEYNSMTPQEREVLFRCMY